MSIATLTLSDIHAAYLQKEILRGVSLNVRAGELVMLTGENGAGKSTVLKVTAGLLRPSQGSVLFNGQALGDLQIEDRQKLGIGYLMQGGRVFPNLTVQENFDLATAHTRRDGRTTVSLGDWFKVLRERQGDRAGLLSGGQRQMLAIELVLAQRPEVLLLDEPLGALSGETATQMLEAVTAYVRETAAAALLVEHSPAASNYSTRQLRLINGALDNINNN